MTKPASVFVGVLLPQDLADELTRVSQQRNWPRSQLIVELLRQALPAAEEASPLPTMPQAKRVSSGFMRRPWTTAEDTIIRAWTGSLKDLAAELCRSFSSTSQRRGKLGLTKPYRHPQKLIDLLREMHSKGFDDSDVAREAA